MIVDKDTCSPPHLLPFIAKEPFRGRSSVQSPGSSALAGPAQQPASHSPPPAEQDGEDAFSDDSEALEELRLLQQREAAGAMRSHPPAEHVPDPGLFVPAGELLALRQKMEQAEKRIAALMQSAGSTSEPSHGRDVNTPACPRWLCRCLSFAGLSRLHLHSLP